MAGYVLDEPIYRHPLTCVRVAHGWTYQDVADLIAGHARQLRLGGMATRREKIWRWEHVGVVPDMRSQQALAAALDISPERVGLLPWPRWLPAGEEIRTDFAWTDAGTRAALNDTLEHAMQDRRGFLALTGAALTSLAMPVPAPPQEAEQATLAARGGRVDERVLRWIEQKIPGLRRMDDRLGGESLRNVIDAELRVVTDLLDRATLSGNQRLRLHAAAAEFSQLAGWVSFDSGRQSAGQRYYQAGLHAAHSAGDHLLGANVLACMSLQSALTGHPNEGIALAEAAQRSIKNDGSPRVKAMVATREARAHAKAGNRRECVAALGRADHHLDAADRGNNDPDWIYYFDEAELIAQTGACWLDLNQPQAALTLLDQALSGIDPSYVRDRTIYHTRQAAAHLQLDELEHSCELLQTAAGLATQCRSARAVASIKTLRTRMNKYSHEPTVRALDDHLVAIRA